MFLKTLCQIVLLVFICVVSADQYVFDSETNDVGIKSEITHIGDNVFHLNAVVCTSDADCHHLGKCETRGGTKLCDCKSGTSGVFCERVDECADNPVKCGTREDVSCVYDVVQERAVCKCDNVSKTYVEDEERCMSPCTKYGQCGLHGECYHEIGNLAFCACELGTSGDYCEIIDECHNKHVDCGLEPDAICTLGGQGKVYCKCSGTNRGFDYDEKVCKDCSGCGENALKEGCAYRDGVRKCSCKLRYYSSEKGICEDCKCGPNGYGCDFVNGTKICKCYPGYKPTEDECARCLCGSESTNCEFKDDKKVCTCKEGYIQSSRDGICTQVCNNTNPCENGGKCIGKVCDCPKGTSGPLCKTIDDCLGRSKCGKADCLYNVTSQEAYCKCSNGKVFDDVAKECRVCDCGTYSKYDGCSYVQGKKRCRCMDAYEDRMGECTLCWCKGYSSMYGCHFEGANMVCNCLKGYAQVGNECKKCDCGDHGKCNLSWGSKYCTCDKDYVESGGECRECSCGSNGECHYESGRKSCICNKGYKVYGGTCKDCNCGPNADCELGYSGQKQCSCKSGYAMKNGICTECNCEPGTSCLFYDNPYSNKKKDCYCPAGYVNSGGGTCEDCKCGIKGANCTKLVFTKCICPKGYEEKPEFFSIGSTCKDIDECLDNYACPYSTNCVNIPGSYECECKAGYEEKTKWSNYDIKVDGCEDIDECVREFKPCNDLNSRCVNTPGSYRCDCTEGYYSSKGYSEKYSICYPDSRPWRTATIVVGCLSAVIVIGLLIGICIKHAS